MFRIKSIKLCLIISIGFLSCQPENNLSDPLASKGARRLYNNLIELSDSSVLIGHKDALSYGVHWKAESFRSDMNDVVGDFPAIFGWDFGHIGESVNIDSVSFTKMKKWAADVYERGGINIYCWHAKNLASGENSWDTTSCVSSILPGEKNHSLLINKLDLIADFIGDLKTGRNKLMPVFFRPFHEMNGHWFWWGAQYCTPEEFKALYRFTVNYLRNEKQLHNIIYVYSTDVFQSSEAYLKYYPGDEYIDVLGFDDYKGLRSKENIGFTVDMLETLDSLASVKSKLFAITETGLEKLENKIWFTDVLLSTLKTNKSTLKTSWVLFWRNGNPNHFYVPYSGHSSAADFIEFKNDLVTMFLTDIPKIYK